MEETINKERQQSLVNARRACLMLTEFAIGQAPTIILNHGQREEVSCLLEEFGRLDARERRQIKHARKIGKEKGGRPPSKNPSQVALAKRKSRAKQKQKEKKPE